MEFQACGRRYENQFAYVSNTACDRHGFVQDFEVAPANLHRRVTFNDLYRRITENYSTTEAVAVDAGYKIYSNVNTKATLKYARITHFYPPVR